MLAFAPPRPRKRPSLTPMIDVVFLMLVFFMLASQFGIDRVLPLTAGGAGAGYHGPPRLITLRDDGVFLNGVATDIAALPAAIAPMMTAAEDAIILQPSEDVPLQILMDVAGALQQSGYHTLLIME